jgi:hypothetical protein
MWAKVGCRRQPCRLSVSRRARLGGFSRRLFSISRATMILGIVINASASSSLSAECDQVAASHCQSEVSNCQAKCDRAFHRTEAVHACHQECQSNYVSCRTDAQCK